MSTIRAILVTVLAAALLGGGVMGCSKPDSPRQKKQSGLTVLCSTYPMYVFTLQVTAGCEGVFFLPYLTGERTPHADPNARACWIGMHNRTTKNELVRSVLEGVTFAMNDALTAFKEQQVTVKEIRLSGGGARSEFWRQLQADIYGTTCVTINAEEGPAYGVALLAAVGTGRFKDVRQACKAGIRITRTIKPQAKLKKLYEAHYTQYRRLYPALKDEFAAMAGL